MALYKIGDVVRFRPEIVTDPDAHLKYGFNFEPDDSILIGGIYCIQKIGSMMAADSKKRTPKIIQSYHIVGYEPFLAGLDSATIRRYTKLRNAYNVSYFSFPEQALQLIKINQTKVSI